MLYSSASSIQYSKFWRFYNTVVYAQNDARKATFLESIEAKPMSCLFSVFIIIKVIKRSLIIMIGNVTVLGNISVKTKKRKKVKTTDGEEPKAKKSKSKLFSLHKQQVNHYRNVNR